MTNGTISNGNALEAPHDPPLFISIIVRLPTMVALWLKDEASYRGMSTSAMAADILLYRKTQQSSDAYKVPDPVAMAPTRSLPEQRPSETARRRQRRQKHGQRRKQKSFQERLNKGAVRRTG